MADPDGVVERFFAHLTARDWDRFGALLAEEVERVGPFGDRAVGRDRYVDLLRALVPSDYGNDVHRVIYAADGRSAFARVTEHLVYPHGTFHLEEAYAFEIGAGGSIDRLEVFWQTPGSDPAGFGSATSEESYAAKDA
jgi:ketosteroid isomerase-like protein